MCMIKNIKLVAQSGKQGELKSLLVAMVHASVQEKGCLRYELYEVVESEGTFLLMESWASTLDLENHKLTKHFVEFLALAPTLIAQKSAELLVSING